MNERQHKTTAMPALPERPPVDLKDCIEELLRFTLASHVDGTLGVNLGLSTDYCSTLLQEDTSNPFTHPTGVPPYPLYKSLARSLYQSISSGTFLRTRNVPTLTSEDSSIRQEEDVWNRLIREKGSDLQNMLKTVGFQLHVQEPFFSQLRDCLKTIEGRCALGDYNKIEPGALILFNRCLILQVEDVHKYPSFHDMLKAESLMKVLPGVKIIEEGVQVYRNFYSEEKERLNGVLAIFLTKPASQLYHSISSILSGLGYGGIQRLLNFVHTVGTIPESLPPSASSLISSFLLPHNPDFEVD